MHISEYILGLRLKLNAVYDERESKNLALYLAEELFGKQFVRDNHLLNAIQIKQLDEASERLLKNEPIQYITGEAWFYGKQFIVTPDVLIPRPETEELIEWIISENKMISPVILDIGTGSGCIPVILKSELPNAIVYSLDISDNAISVAKKNAERYHTEITFLSGDILNDANLQLPSPDIIVSNPPYVDPSDIHTLHKNVVDHEPHIALFGEPGEPLIFYRKISAFAFQHLNAPGKLFFELPENKSDEIRNIVINSGLKNIRIKKDTQEKDRMLYAEKMMN